METTTATTVRPRCHIEFCCNEATFEVESADRSAKGNRQPVLWGWCNQHKHHAWSAAQIANREAGRSEVVSRSEAETMARVTGATSATVTYEHRDATTGELITDAVHTFTR